MFVFIIQSNSTDREDRSAVPVTDMPSNLKQGYVDLPQESNERATGRNEYPRLSPGGYLSTYQPLSGWV
jgi:hypothetical protein